MMIVIVTVVMLIVITNDDNNNDNDDNNNHHHCSTELHGIARSPIITIQKGVPSPFQWMPCSTISYIFPQFPSSKFQCTTWCAITSGDWHTIHLRRFLQRCLPRRSIDLKSMRPRCHQRWNVGTTFWEISQIYRGFSRVLVMFSRHVGIMLGNSL